MPNLWRSTMIANAAKDPVWQAKVSSEVARLPQLKKEIEKKCTTCHMPMGKTQADTDGQPVALLGDGFYNPNHPLHNAAVDGVSCTLCHQVLDKNLGQEGSFSGGYLVDTSTNVPDRLIYGPYEQPVTQEMQGVSGFTPLYSPHMGTSEHCGTCHNLYTPYVDAEGDDHPHRNIAVEMLVLADCQKRFPAGINSSMYKVFIIDKIHYFLYYKNILISIRRDLSEYGSIHRVLHRPTQK